MQLSAEEIRLHPGRFEKIVSRSLQLHAQLRQVDIQQPPLPLPHLASDDNGSALERSISVTTAPGTWLSGATLMAVASRRMMSASLPGVSREHGSMIAMERNALRPKLAGLSFSPRAVNQTSDLRE